MPKARRGSRPLDPFANSLPSFKAYCERVGAECVNFKRYMRRDYIGQYYSERVLIELEGDGSVKVSDPLYAPDEKEAAAIKAELATLKLPQSIKADESDLEKLKLQLEPDANLDAFEDRDDNDLIIMVQERIDNDDGGKIFIPWTLFSDRVWRKMEPDGKLPLWRPKLKKHERRARVMIHEGVKAAKAANRIVREREDHPWLGELALYEHWGAIGGALAPQRSDYRPLHHKNPAEVVYVCDNDIVGKRALAKVSEAYKRPLKGVKFDNNFEQGWDVADPMPKCYFVDGRYVGPELNELMVPATWAINWKPPATPKSKREPEISVYFAEEWARSVVPEAFVHKDFPWRILSAKEFDCYMTPFAGGIKQKLSQLMAHHGEIQSDNLMYDPSKPSAFYSKGRSICFNTHVGTRIEKRNDSAAKFLDFARHLFPAERDRREVLRWIATLLVRPDVKMRYGLLLLSDPQGVGKSTLGDSILAPLIGRHNYTAVSENDVLKSTFNYWCAEKRLVFVHEIHTGGSTFNLYNSLKSLITDQFITVHRKYAVPYLIDNWCHLIICSNHQVRIDDTDRRFLVPEVTKEPRSSDWWREFHKWLRCGGLSAILNWANFFLEKNEAVSTAEIPLHSAAKENLIQGSYAPEQAVVVNLFRMLRGKKIYVADSQVVHSLRQMFPKREVYIKPHGVRKIAQREGFYITQAVWNPKWPCMTTDTRLIVSDENLLAWSRDKLKELELTNVVEIVTKMTTM